MPACAGFRGLGLLYVMLVLSSLGTLLSAFVWNSGVMSLGHCLHL